MVPHSVDNSRRADACPIDVSHRGGSRTSKRAPTDTRLALGGHASRGRDGQIHQDPDLHRHPEGRRTPELCRVACPAYCLKFGSVVRRA